jgi:hypothetical protein
MHTGGALYALARFWIKEKIRVEVEEASIKKVFRLCVPDCLLILVTK